MATSVTRRGQITIPKPIRERLGIQPGNAVDFELAADGRVVMFKVGGEPSVSFFERFRGIAGAGSVSV